MDVGIGEGCLQDVWTEDWCEHEVEMVGGGMWTGIEKRLKGDRRSLTLHGPHTPGTSRSCQILASHQRFSRREQHTSFSRQKSYTSCHFFGESTTFYRGEWGKEMVLLEHQGTRRGRGATISLGIGKPCHDLPSR